MPTSAGDRIGAVHGLDAADGVRLAARVAGPDDALPILFLHGYSQGALAWARQLTGPLAARFRLVALDLRGHGMSEAGDLDRMADGATWAGDLAAAIEALTTRPPVIVAWSYGGRVVGEYLKLHGDGGIAGLVFVAAVTQSVLADGARPTGSAAAPLAGMADDDDAVSFAATAAFLDTCTARPLPPAERDLMMAVNAAVRPPVRRALGRLVSDNDLALAVVTRPTLVIHGAEDRVIRLASSQNIAARVPGARLEVMPGVGHAPFMEAPETFDGLLGGFAAAAG